MWLTGGTVLFWLGTALLGTYVMRHEFEEVFDSALQETAQRLIPLIVDELEQREDANEARSIDDGAVPEHEEYLTYQVRDPNGRVMLRSHDAPLLPFEAPLAQGFADTPSERVYTEAAARGSFFLQISDPFAHRREAMLEAASALFLPVLALAPLSILAIWLIVRTSVAPISSLRREIGMRHGGNLAPLYARRLPAELEGIAKSVDRLLERLRSALEAERHFASNAAHELRTPIAGALAQTQRLLAELPPGKERKRGEEIEAALTRLSRLSEKLLQLARAEAGLGTSAADFDILPIVRMVVGDFQRSGKTEPQVHLDAPDNLSLMWKADADALAIVLRNLIENAILHGGDKEPVVVKVEREGVITVKNGGPVMAADQLQNLGRRFQRHSTSTEGTGLGLAIVTALLRQMGGTVEFLSPARGHRDGFEARVVIQNKGTRALPL